MSSIKIKTFGKDYAKVFLNSFGIVTALAWNSAFQATFENVDITNINIIGPWIYAFIITLICVTITRCFSGVLEK